MRTVDAVELFSSGGLPREILADYFQDSGDHVRTGFLRLPAGPDSSPMGHTMGECDFYAVSSRVARGELIVLDCYLLIAPGVWAHSRPTLPQARKWAKTLPSEVVEVVQRILDRAEKGWVV